MANQRLKPEQLVTNTNAFSDFKAIGNYKPSKAEHGIKHGEALHKATTDARATEAQTEVAQAFHDYILVVKDYVTAEYGVSSNELQSLGLKKKNEYKRVGSRKSGDAPAV